MPVGEKFMNLGCVVVALCAVFSVTEANAVAHLVPVKFLEKERHLFHVHSGDQVVLELDAAAGSDIQARILPEATAECRVVDLIDHEVGKKMLRVTFYTDGKNDGWNSCVIRLVRLGNGDANYVDVEVGTYIGD
jgi:hypothetical protein